jgi:hypothetical protein
MRRASSILVLFVLLAFGVSLAVPAEDVPETAYDESEALPYENAPLFSVVVPQASVRIAEADSCSSQLRFNSSARRCNRSRENDTQSQHVPDSLTIRNHSLRC